MDNRTREEIDRELKWLAKQVHGANQHGRLRSIVCIEENHGESFSSGEHALLIRRQQRLYLQDRRYIWFDESLKDVLNADWSWNKRGIQLQLVAKSQQWYLRFWAPESIDRLWQHTPRNWFEGTLPGFLLRTRGLFSHMKGMEAANLAEARKWDEIFPFDLHNAKL